MKISRKRQDQKEIYVQEFLDMIAPSTIRFYTDYFICGNTFRSVWALREYPTVTEEQALLKRLGEKAGVTLRIYIRRVNGAEERQIISNAASKNRMNRANVDDLQQAVQAEHNLQDVAAVIAHTHRNREPLLHSAVYIEMAAADYEQLKRLQSEVMTELVRCRLNVDRLLLQQKKGFQTVIPGGRNEFQEQFERVLPAGSVANLYPFNYSGKTDTCGFYIGKDKYGRNVLVDFNQRTEDKTNGSILILGNSGQGKSYLLKLILCNLREAGMRILCLDPEMEYKDLTQHMGGCFVDLMDGSYVINPLEPKLWSVGEEAEEAEAPKPFRINSQLSQHISFLKDFFYSNKVYTERELDVLEIMLQKFYASCGIDDETDFLGMRPEEYPILSEFYDFVEREYKDYDVDAGQIYTAELLQNVLLGLYSICKGAESKFFNGHTNITSSDFVTFGVKGVLQASKSLRNAILFNVLSYMSNALLTAGNTVASLDEFYLFLSNLTAVEYVRNFMKRVRKKNSAVIIASQNLEDFNIEGIREYTKPLFSIPTHQFLFHAGTIDEKFYTDTLQLEDCEFELIRYPQRGVCLYKCGNERYNLMVRAPEYKASLFGNSGGV